MSDQDRDFLEQAIALSKKCTPNKLAFSVGAIIVDSAGEVLGEGYSRELAARDHAEEVALQKAARAKTDVRGATLYSSLEPCGERLSGRECCVDKIIAAGIARVVCALDEPSRFVVASGAKKLRAAGIEVAVCSELADQVRTINAHLSETP